MKILNRPPPDGTQNVNSITWMLAQFLIGPWAWVIPIGAFVLLFTLLLWKPRSYIDATFVNLNLPSERAIPADVPSGNRRVDVKDPLWTFRYGPIGAELGAGIPYWIFAAMPRLFPEKFAPFGDYRAFGFQDDEDDDLYYRRRSLPRGLVLTDAGASLPGFPIFGVQLKRVTINCSTCHRGVFQDPQGRRVAVDGMPNHTADLQGFKRLFREAFADSRFTPERVIDAIDQELRSKNAPPLNSWERTVYQGFVSLAQGVTPASWMTERPTNGVGRIDAFNAMKIEVIGAPDDHSAATTDFPSIWNQDERMRPVHHWDGNTTKITTRDFGAVIGIGGKTLSIDRDNVDRVGRWINLDLNSPVYPFKKKSEGEAQRGKEIFAQRCANCHGTYDRATQTVGRTMPTNYMTVIKGGSKYPNDPWVCTDEERFRGFGPEASNALGRYGEQQGLWHREDFAPTGGYLAGPLDGIWARAPYLHNGSVPTIRDLLLPVAQRKAKFFRGNVQYNEADMGFKDNAGTFEYDTTGKGNSNAGHEVVVSDRGEQDALIAYLQTL